MSTSKFLEDISNLKHHEHEHKKINPKFKALDLVDLEDVFYDPKSVHAKESEPKDQMTLKIGEAVQAVSDVIKVG